MLSTRNIYTYPNRMEHERLMPQYQSAGFSLPRS